MKIQTVTSYSKTNKNQTVNNYLSTPTVNLTDNKDSHSPSFGVAGMPPYKTRWVSKLEYSPKCLAILEKSDSELRDTAEYFHNGGDSFIKFLCEIPKKGLINSFLGKTDEELSNKAYNRFLPFIKAIQLKKSAMLKEIKELELKLAKGISNEVEQKDRLSNQFLSLVEVEKQGRNVPLTNGILVYGNSKEKEGFIDWITKSAEVVVKRFKHDPNNPMKTIENIVNTAKNAEPAFQHSNIRTLLVIDDLDKMLINKDNIDGIEMVGRFKGFVEHLSQDYHTTIVTKTDKPLSDFEPASIASHRFGIKIDLKDGISQEELKRLEELKKEVKRLDDKSNNKKEIIDKFMVDNGHNESYL